MVKDRFSPYSATLGQPATSVAEAVPDDRADLEQVLSGVNGETPGSLRVTAKDGTTGTVFMAAGISFPLRIAKVWATGTAAAGIRGLI